MSTAPAALDRIGQTQAVAQAKDVSQATAIEQSRAIAEVQAAVTVAQRIPRNISNALAAMRESCGKLGLANKAFYSVPNRGSGPSVHLARELARIWGNVQYGVHELRRDDDAGQSEVQSFAWDLETNTRSTRTFIAPHARMKGKERQALTDLNDIYLSNQNVGARAVRECIWTVLPDWFVDEAIELCRNTLENGEGKPLETRVQEAIGGFASLGITQPQLENKLKKKSGQWTAGDIAQLVIVYTSIQRGDVTKEEEFPANPVSAAEINGNAAAPAAPKAAAPKEQRADTPKQEQPPAAAAEEPTFDEVRTQVAGEQPAAEEPPVEDPDLPDWPDAAVPGTVDNPPRD